jgi:signal transduction histidine kinase
MAHFTPHFQPVRLGNVLQKEISLLQEQLDDDAVRIVNQVPAALILDTDENFLAVIVRNLLQNAVRHSDGNKPIHVTGNLQELTITNPSTTADPAAMNQRLTNTWIDSGASGLGLQIAGDLAGRIYARLFFRGEDRVSLTAVLRWTR